jgi:hypothetical protein
MGARAAPVRCGGALILYGDRAVSTLAVLPLGAALSFSKLTSFAKENWRNGRHRGRPSR